MLLPAWQAILQVAAVAAARLHQSACAVTGLVLHLEPLQGALQQELCWQGAVTLLLKPYQALIGEVCQAHLKQARLAVRDGTQTMQGNDKAMTRP